MAALLWRKGAVQLKKKPPPRAAPEDPNGRTWKLLKDIEASSLHFLLKYDFRVFVEIGS